VRMGDVPIPYLLCFQVAGLITDDGQWFPPTILSVGVADTHSVIQVRLGGGSTTLGLAAVSMLWGSSSASAGGWSSGVGHGGQQCFSFVSVPLVDWIVIFFSSRDLSAMWGAMFLI
jgi:hypothetical protein